MASRQDAPKLLRATVAACFALLGLPVLASCGTQGFCLFTFRQGGQNRCLLATCGSGASFNDATRRCECDADRITLGGQCLTQKDADEYCGVGQHFESGGCQQNKCPMGAELDLGTGKCVAREGMERVASGIGVKLGRNEKLGCPAGQKLVMDGDNVACVPLSESCARDEIWTGSACRKIGSCPTGSAWDVSSGQCTQYARQADGQGVTVDPSQWTSANFGPPGGAGTTSFCGAFARKPWAFGVVEGSTAPVRINVNLGFPGSEVAQGQVAVVAVFDGSGRPVPAKGLAEIDASARSLLELLKRGGGSATQPAASTIVRCSIVSAGKPRPVPAAGGL